MPPAVRDLFSRLCYERFEDIGLHAVLFSEAFGMPLHADGVFIGRGPYRLDDAVLRMRRSLRLFCQAADGLVVHGIYHHRIAVVVGKEPGDRYFHIVYIAFHDVGAAVKAPATVDVGQILYERTAEDDVQKLTAATDPQQRPVFFNFPLCRAPSPVL